MKRTKEGDLDSSGLHKMPVVESGRQGHSAKVSQVVKVGYIDILDSQPFLMVIRGVLLLFFAFLVFILSLPLKSCISH